MSSEITEDIALRNVLELSKQTHLEDERRRQQRELALLEAKRDALVQRLERERVTATETETSSDLDLDESEDDMELDDTQSDEHKAEELPTVDLKSLTLETTSAAGVDTVSHSQLAASVMWDECWPWTSRTAAIVNYLKHVEWSKGRSAHGVGSGLRNLGNSCFLNATLQCLTYLPGFAQLASSKMHSSLCETGLSGRFCALCCVEEVVTLLLTHLPSQCVRPTSLFKHVSAVNSLLAAGCQEDANEYFLSLLDKMELAYDCSIRSVLEAAKGKEQSAFEMEDKSTAQMRTFSNPIKMIFEGSLVTEVMCGGCYTKTITYEPYYCLSLDVDVDSVSESLCKFSNEECMFGENKYFCEVCKKKKLARKKTCVSKLPSVLCIHLKRFKAVSDGLSYKMEKDCSPVEFDMDLDMGTFVHSAHCADSDRGYALCSALVHSGPSLGYGHYYALCKAPDGNWHQMNDSSVQKIKARSVLKEQAYILFYRRKSHADLVAAVKDVIPEAKMASLVPPSISSVSVKPLATAATTRTLSMSASASKESSDEVVLNDDYFVAGHCDTDATDSGSPVFVSKAVVPESML